MSINLSELKWLKNDQKTKYTQWNNTNISLLKEKIRDFLTNNQSQIITIGDIHVLLNIPMYAKPENYFKTEETLYLYEKLYECISNDIEKRSFNLNPKFNNIRHYENALKRMNKFYRPTHQSNIDNKEFNVETQDVVVINLENKSPIKINKKKEEKNVSI